MDEEYSAGAASVDFIRFIIEPTLFLYGNRRMAARSIFNLFVFLKNSTVFEVFLGRGNETIK